MRRSLFLLTAAAVALSVSGCGSKKSESSTDTLSGEWTLCDEDGFTAGQTKFVFGEKGDFSAVYGDGEKLEITYSGKYKYAGGVIKVDYDDINTLEDVKKLSDYFSDFTDEDLETALEHQKASLETVPKELFISDEAEHRVTYIGSEHEYRSEAYTAIANDLMYDSYDLKGYGQDDSYSFISSDESLNNGDIKAFSDIKEALEERVSSDNALRTYTPEEGFTEDFDFDSHEWLIVMRGDSVCAAGIGEDFESEVFGITNAMWLFDESGSFEIADEETENSVKNLSDLYDLYHE